MKILLPSLAVLGMLLIGGYVAAPVFAISAPLVCTLFNHPTGCIEPEPIFVHAGGDGNACITQHTYPTKPCYVAPSSSSSGL